MEDCNKVDEPWFTPVVLESPEQPMGFQTWVEDITQEKYNVILPNGEKINVRMYIDMNGTFDSGSYTSMLVNRYKDIYDL